MQTDMEKAANLLSIALALIAAGCMDRRKNDQVLQSIQNSKLITSPGLEFRSGGYSETKGSSVRLGFIETVGELVTTNNSPLPPDLVESIANNIRTIVTNQGCTITGEGNGPGIHYTPASKIRNSNLERASLDYSLNGSDAEVEISVIERDYPGLRPNEKVVGQLIFSVHESR